MELFCSSGLPKPVIRWLRNGQELTGNEPGVSILEDGTLLILASLSPLDNGEYTCAAVNEAGSTEKKYQLKVNGNRALTIGFSSWPLKSFLHMRCGSVITVFMTKDCVQ